MFSQGSVCVCVCVCVCVYVCVYVCIRVNSAEKEISLIFPCLSPSMSKNLAISVP